MKNVTIVIASVIAFFSAFTTDTVAFAAATCKVNGKIVPCAQLGNQFKAFADWGIGLVVLLLILAIWATIFWFRMLIHAITHDIDNKPLWIIIILFTHLVGAFIYYRAVKRPFDRTSRIAK
jgi:hypothetical protein